MESPEVVHDVVRVEYFCLEVRKSRAVTASLSSLKDDVIVMKSVRLVYEQGTGDDRVTAFVGASVGNQQKARVVVWKLQIFVIFFKKRSTFTKNTETN